MSIVANSKEAGGTAHLPNPSSSGASGVCSAIGAVGRAYDHGRNNSGFGTPVNPPVNIAHLDNDVAGM